MSKFKLIKPRNNFRLLGALALLLGAASAHADLDISVTRGTAAPKPIAIVPFANAPGATVDVASVVEADLARSGLFSTLNRADMLEKPTDPAKVDYRNWRTLGRDDIVVGQMHQQGDGYATRFYLLDVGSQQQLLAYDMPATSDAHLRTVGHKIADLIYEKLTGVKGYFDTQIAYITVTGYGEARKWQLIVADSDGENSHGIAFSHDPLMSPSWSPDGKQLSYVGYDHIGHMAIYVHNLGTGVQKKITLERGINSSPAWSPDGTKLAVTLSFETNPDIYVVDIASGSRKRLTNDPAIDTEPSWSPDGQSIVFTSDRGGSPQIYKISATGGPAQRLTFEGKQNLRPVYSPDGKYIALVNADGSSYRIGLLDVQSNQLRLISNGPLDESPSFAPNSAVVIYTAEGPRGSELETISVSGEVRQTLHQVGSEVREPAWSPYVP